MTNPAREAILGRVRQALKRPSPEPHWTHEPVKSDRLFPLPEANEAGLRQRFRDEFAAIQGEWLEADSVESGKALIAERLHREEIASVLAPDSPKLRKLLDGLSTVRWVDGNTPTIAGWDAMDVGVTLAECLIAESGSVLVSSALSGRAPSVLPPIHWIIATADQLVLGLEEAIAGVRQKYGAQLPSSFTCVSGPSRTADIEKILVFGAHGPRRVWLLLLPAGSLDG